jgi:hypothetical protein
MDLTRESDSTTKSWKQIKNKVQGEHAQRI